MKSKPETSQNNNYILLENKQKQTKTNDKSMKRIYSFFQISFYWL